MPDRGNQMTDGWIEYSDRGGGRLTVTWPNGLVYDTSFWSGWRFSDMFEAWDPFLQPDPGCLRRDLFGHSLRMNG